MKSRVKYIYRIMLMSHYDTSVVSKTVVAQNHRTGSETVLFDYLEWLKIT